jgi:cell division protein FtsI (penicillin-binding protein 3)
MSGRTRIIFGGLLAVYALVVLRAFHIQVLGASGLRERSARQYGAKIPLIPKRGAILDRTGSELAVSLSTKSIFVQPPKLSDSRVAAEILARRVALSPAELQQLFASERSFVWVRRQIASVTADEAVREVQTAQGRGRSPGGGGIGTVEEPKRFYPNRELAASLLGFTNLDSEGIEGVELSLDKYLRGERAYLVGERDARGRVIIPASAPGKADSRGHTVALTIDRNIQHVAESELREAVERYAARGGTAIVMRPGTGEILALATYPSYNPNAPAAAPPEYRRNRVITDCFEPGSTFKVFTLASALELGDVRPEDRFDCENGAYRVGGRVIRDIHRHDVLTVPEILKYSSNIGFVKIAEAMDPDRFHDMIRTFGFGTRTGIELVGEIGGIVPSREVFTPIRRATVSFGQGIAVTPLQLITAMAAVINGGRMMKPYIVREILDSEGRVVFRGRPTNLRRVVSPANSALLRDMMGEVVQADGTGRRARIEGFHVGGKTGTAQKVEPGTGRYSPDKRVASFIGFLPLQDPELIILVTVDEPKGEVYGGVVAAPVFNRIAVKTAYYLGLAPTEAASGAVARTRDAAPRKAPVMKVSMGRADGAAVMPDLAGLSMGRVVEIMGQYPVKLTLSGSGVARTQIPAPGTVLVPGAECTVIFGRH